MSESTGGRSWAERGAKWKQAAQDFADKATEEVKGYADKVIEEAADLPADFDPGVHGRRLGEVTVGTHTLDMFDGGFIRAKGMLDRWGKFERLVSVTYRESTVAQDMSKVGAALSDMLSFGTASTEKIKTKASATVATEVKVYSGEVKPKHGMALEGLAARRGLGSPAAASPASTTGASTSGAPDIVEQIRKLADLHAAGILTDEEFAAKKADLLSRM